MKRYLIIGRARSGTTLIHETLREHPQVAAFREEVAVDIFFRHGLGIFGVKRGKGATDAEKAAMPYTLFDTLCQLEISGTPAAIGMKVALLRPDFAATVVRAVQKNYPDLHIISLFRSDILQQYCSWKKAKTSGQWHARKGETSGSPSVDFSINLPEFANFLLNAKAIDEELHQLGKTQPHLALSYETDIEQGDLAATFGKVYDFLELDASQHPGIGHSKIANSGYQHLDNYHEAQALAEKTRHFSLEELTKELGPLEKRYQLKKKRIQYQTRAKHFAQQLLHNLWSSKN